MSDQVCGCSECVLAGCDRPVVTLAASGRHPQRELHGRELARFYADRDARRGYLTKLVAEFQAKGAGK